MDTATRRQLLKFSDELLNAVEVRRLHDHDDVPSQLRDRIIRLATLVSDETMPAPTRLADAHRYLLALQERLLPGATVLRRRVRGPHDWKNLELPPYAGEVTPDWTELAQLTVERALDRWQFVNGRARTAGRRGDTAATLCLFRESQAAWANYWRLAEELSAITAGPAKRDTHSTPEQHRFLSHGRQDGNGPSVWRRHFFT
jgi:hypothetical protein